MNEITPQEAAAMNQFLQRWAATTARSMKATGKGSISATLSNKNRKSYGIIESMSFKFPRHGVFVEMGVFGGLTRKEAIAQGKLKPMPWFNPVLERRIPTLIDGLAKHTGDMIINAEKALIKNA